MTGYHLSNNPSPEIFLNIGSFVFKIYSQNIPLNLEYQAAYGQFLKSDSKEDQKTIPVQLLPKRDMPDLASLTKIFDTAQSWAMYSDSHDKFIVLQSSTDKEPEWVARLTENLQGVEIYCDSSLNGINPLRYPLDQILVIHLLAGRGLLIHAAGLVMNGRGYIFAGQSGAGKSTISNLFRDFSNLKSLSDDRIVIEKTGKNFFMYGTPWPGDAGIAVNDCARLHGIFFLNHTEENSIKVLTPGDAFKKLFKVASLPLYDEKDLQKSLDFCENLLSPVKAYELNFRLGPEIVEEIISFVSG